MESRRSARTRFAPVKSITDPRAAKPNTGGLNPARRLRLFGLFPGKAIALPGACFAGELADSAGKSSESQSTGANTENRPQSSLVLKDLLTVYSPEHDMIDSTLRTCPRFPWHLSSPHEQNTMWNPFCQSENRPLIGRSSFRVYLLYRFLRRHSKILIVRNKIFLNIRYILSRRVVDRSGYGKKQQFLSHR